MHIAARARPGATGRARAQGRAWRDRWSPGCGAIRPGDCRCGGERRRRRRRDPCATSSPALARSLRTSSPRLAMSSPASCPSASRAAFLTATSASRYVCLTLSMGGLLFVRSSAGCRGKTMRPRALQQTGPAIARRCRCMPARRTQPGAFPRDATGTQWSVLRRGHRRNGHHPTIGRSRTSMRRRPHKGG